jgi:iron(III) transport system permease protein
MLSIMKELPATLLLIPNDSDTLARRIWFATEDLFYAQAGVFALVLLLLSGVLTWLLTIRPLERDGRV